MQWLYIIFLIAGPILFAFTGCLGGINLLYNNDFEDTYEENGFIKHWSCQGEENVFKPVLQSTRGSHKLPFSGLCTRRTSKNQGPCQLIESLVLADNLYKVQGWTKLLNGRSKEENASIELWLRWKEFQDAKEERKLLGVRNKFLENDDWVFWNSQFHIPSAEKQLQYVLLYFKGPPKHMDIMIDEMKLERIIQRDNWRQDADDRIDNVRKRDVILKRCSRCKTKVSVKSLSFFESTKLGLGKWIKIMDLWARQMTTREISTYQETTLKTCSEMCRHFREQCQSWFEQHPPNIGGEGVHVLVKVLKRCSRDCNILIVTDSQTGYLLHNRDARYQNDDQRIKFPKSTKEYLQKARLEVKQLSSQFAFGASVHYDAIKRNPAYRTFVRDNFEWTTMEHALKWPYMERTQGAVNYSIPDEMMDILIKDMGMNVRGHCIFWAVPEEQPKWLVNASDLTVKASLRRRLYDVLDHYKTRIDIWDVNNEMLHGAFFGDRVGETVRDWMFFEAHKILPDGRFFVNDYEVLSAPFYTQSYLEEIKKFQSHGVPLAGIGVQGHFTGTAHPEILKERLDTLATLGLPIWITELDVKNTNDSSRAETLEKVLRIAFSHPAVNGILLWSFWDKHDWRGNTSLFYGNQFKPNEAGKRYLDLRKQWNLNIQNLEPSEVNENECIFTFRAFHGTYNLQVTLPGNSVVTKVINVLNDPRKLVLVFKERPEEPAEENSLSIDNRVGKRYHCDDS